MYGNEPCQGGVYSTWWQLVEFNIMAAAVTVEKADVLQSFWGLSSLDEEKRVESSRELITALLKKQVGNAITPPLRAN